jgi:hypothetical protein
LVLVPLAGAEGQAGDGGREFGRIDGLGDMGLETGKERAFPILGAGECGEGGGRDILGGRVSPHLTNQIIPILLGHANIADEDIGAELPDHRQGFGRTINENAADQLAGVRLVIDHEHLEAGEGCFLAVEGCLSGKNRRAVNGPG